MQRESCQAFRPVGRGLMLVIALTLAAPAWAEELRVALGHTDITPPIGSPMAGYSKRVEPADSVHDPLTAGVVLFEGSETSLALITFDLIHIVSPRIIEGVKALGIDHVIMAGSHTHAGPKTDIDDFPHPENSWKRTVENKVIDMVRVARANTSPGRIAVGKGLVYLGYNRRVVDNSGDVTMRWWNPDRQGLAWGQDPARHPVDPTVGVIRIDDADGRPRAVLVHYSCHPVVLGSDNLAISADFPGAMREKLRQDIAQAFGKQVDVFFLQGAPGDINPYNRRYVDEGVFDAVERTGVLLAKEVYRVFEKLTPRARSADELHVIERAFEFEHRWEPDKRVGVNLATILIGGDLALAAMPGEPFVGLQLDLAARSPVANSFLVGYAVSGPEPWPDYIPTIRAAAEGGYGASYSTHIEVGAGERLIDEAVISLYKMTGRLTDKPER